MQCSEAHAKLMAGSDDEALRAHLRSCPACSTLADSPRLMAALSSERRPEAADLQRMWEGTSAALSREAHWSRSLSHLPTGQRLVLLALSVSVALGWVVLFSSRPDLRQPGALPVRAMLGAASVVLMLGLWVAYRPIHRPALPRWVQLGALIAAIVVAWLPVVWPAAAVVGAEAGAGLQLYTRAARCLSWGAAIGLLLLGLLWLTARGDRGLSRVPLGVFLVAGLAGTVAVQLHCPVADPLHVALGHSSVLTVLLAVPLLSHMRRA